ncbi:MAG: hypothetical protein JSV27_02120 [Candidatus Bathyarchaeota archaeon]|nr:MAG: hypothetical protein JSV27_02120 [Candidatus Bathyarchaeota archaeon]
MVTLRAICGRTFEVEEVDSQVEEAEFLCSRCPENDCEIYFDYLYEITHYNNPQG